MITAGGIAVVTEAPTAQGPLFGAIFTFHILLLPGAGVSLLGLILDRDFNGFVRPH